MKLAHIALALSVSLAGVTAGAQTTTTTTPEPHAPGAVKVTPLELYDWSNPSSDPTWRNGYSSGMIVATVKIISLLRQNNLTALGVCIPSGLTNDDLVSIIRSNMAYNTIPRFGATIDNWDQEALLHAAIAATSSFPCR